MRLHVEVFRTDILEILSDLSPIQLQIESNADEKRWLEMEAPSEEDVTFREGVGVAIRTRASARYELSKVAVTATIPEVVLVFRPKLLGSGTGAKKLAFDVYLESADFSDGVEAECPWTGAVRESLALGTQPLAWAFGDALSARFHLSSAADVNALFLLSVRETSLLIGRESIHFEVDFRGTFSRTFKQPNGKQPVATKSSTSTTRLRTVAPAPVLSPVLASVGSASRK